MPFPDWQYLIDIFLIPSWKGDYFGFCFGLEAAPEVGDGIQGQACQGHILIVYVPFFSLYCGIMEPVEEPYPEQGSDR